MTVQKHWSEDPYWQEASERLLEFRKTGQRTITLDMQAIEEVAFLEDGPAYKLLFAMQSVFEQEGMEGMRGAPRVMLALLMRLEEISRKTDR